MNWLPGLVYKYLHERMKKIYLKPFYILSCFPSLPFTFLLVCSSPPCKCQFSGIIIDWVLNFMSELLLGHQNKIQYRSFVKSFIFLDYHLISDLSCYSYRPSLKGYSDEQNISGVVELFPFSWFSMKEGCPKKYSYNIYWLCGPYR